MSRLCDWCNENEVEIGKCAVHHNGWTKAPEYVCDCCDNYDGPSDDELSAFYGASTPQTEAERYNAAAEEKRRGRRG